MATVALEAEIDLIEGAASEAAHGRQRGIVATGIVLGLQLVGLPLQRQALLRMQQGIVIEPCGLIADLIAGKRFELQVSGHHRLGFSQPTGNQFALIGDKCQFTVIGGYGRRGDHNRQARLVAELDQARGDGS